MPPWSVDIIRKRAEDLGLRRILREQSHNSGRARLA